MNRYPLVIVNGYPQEISGTDRLYNIGNITRGRTLLLRRLMVIFGLTRQTTFSRSTTEVVGPLLAAVLAAAGRRLFLQQPRPRLQTAVFGMTPLKGS